MKEGYQTSNVHHTSSQLKRQVNESNSPGYIFAFIYVFVFLHVFNFVMPNIVFVHVLQVYDCMDEHSKYKYVYSITVYCNNFCSSIENSL